MCLLTVSRPGEIARLKAHDVDLDANIVTIRGTKTEKKKHSIRQIPLSPTARAILIERMKVSTEDGHPYLFTAGGSITVSMRRTLKMACEKLGIKYGRRDPHGITFYTARHTATTELAHSNQVDVKTAGTFAGHSDAVMTLYYTHVNESVIQTAVDVLEKNMGSGLLVGAKAEPS